MKDLMLDMMVWMMPAMMPLVYIAGAALAIGALLVIIRLMSGSGGGLIRMAGTVLIALGIFFIACQGAGMWLEVAPSINFGDAANFEFILYPFWQLGLAMLGGGILLRLLSGRREAI